MIRSGLLPDVDLAIIVTTPSVATSQSFTLSRQAHLPSSKCKGRVAPPYTRRFAKDTTRYAPPRHREQTSPTQLTATLGFAL
jgi:hypothetical protein